MKDRKVRSLLSLCQRAGKMTTGEIVGELISRRNAKLIIIAGDASDNTKKKFINKCEHYNTAYIIYSTKAELSAAIGKYDRSVFAVTDKNFADRLISELKGNM